MIRNTAILFLLFMATINLSMAQTHVQTATLYQTSTATTIARSFATSSTSGNLIVVHLDWDGQSRSITTVTDNKGNSYARISGPTNWNGTLYRAELWYAYNITGGGGAITITAKLSGAPTSFSQIYISEYSGIVSSVDPLDQNSVAIGNSTAVSSGAKTTTQSKELIYGVSIGASGTLTTGAGFTNRSTANSNIVEDKTVNSTGSYSAGFTSAGGNWVAQMATFISSSIILPVNLLSFSGNCVGNQIALKWTTAAEINNSYFTIEESEDGYNWSVTGTVKGAANSSTIQAYSFLVDETNSPTSYFRLKQTDMDGNANYFQVISVTNCQKTVSGVKIYPNPTNGRSLSGSIVLKDHEAYVVQIYNKDGRMLSQFQSNESSFRFDFPFILPSGIYYARFSSSNTSITTSFMAIR